MTNTKMLKGKLVEKGVSVQALADFLGVSKRTVYSKLSNGDTITISEANKIVEYLNLKEDEAVSIFFSSTVA